MSRLQDIEKALESINPAQFQEMCDSFLALQNKNYRAFARIGSQNTKQKTVKGTPDSLILLPSGKYILVEYSTNKTSGVKKIKEDVLKCINPSLTKINPEDISEIIVCLNFNLKPAQIESIKKIIQDTRISLNIIMLDDLALQLHLNHRDLVHHYLGLSFDTGQIVSIDKFIQEYNSYGNGIATSLDNAFCHREKELIDLQNLIDTRDLILLTGFPGVGKTRLALEAIKSFLNSHLSFNAYCVSNKHHSLLDDLYSYIKSDEDCILFVDDANRVDFINQIIGFYKSSRVGILKLIITVRDYAYESVSTIATGLTPVRFDVSKFTDEEITSLVEGEPFKISNSDYQKEIVRIADGNPRLAIMAARLAIKTQNLYALTDVSSLFETYFTTLVKDSTEFSDTKNIKFLGLISFFYTLPFKDKILIERLLSKFMLTYDDFIESISKLEQLEIVEIQFEYVKISEQNLGNYFFYKCFVKDELLSFNTLLENYFATNAGRFKDTVIPANNTFGPQKVMSKLRPSLKSYLLDVSNTEKFEFLKTFWFYLQNETLEYIYNEINTLITPKDSVYIFEDKSRNNTYDKNKHLELLSNFYWSSTHLKDALELSFEFVRKSPYFIPELIKDIQQFLLFEKEDGYEGFKRQTILFDVLIEGLRKNDNLLGGSFYAIVKHFLGYQFRHTRGGGRRSTIYLYEYYLPASDEVFEFRKRIWKEIDESYERNSDAAMAVLEQYLQPGTEVNKEIFTSDLEYLIPIVEKHLTPKQFEHCRFVNNLNSAIVENEIPNNKISEFASIFTNPVYEMFIKFDWDRFKNKESYEFVSYEEFEQLKENEIRTSFRFSTTAEANLFWDRYRFLWFSVKENWTFNKALDFIIDENYSIDKLIGTHLLNRIIENKNDIDYVPWSIFKSLLASSTSAKELWNIIAQKDYKHRTQWKFSFFQFLSDSVVNKTYREGLIKTFEETDDSFTVFFERILKFEQQFPGTFKKLMGIIVKKNEDGGAKIKIWEQDFVVYFQQFGNDYDLLMRAYLQQCLIGQHYDHSGKGLEQLVTTKPNFLLTYIEEILKSRENDGIRNNLKLNFVWSIPNIEPVLTEVFEILVAKSNFYAILEHPCNAFFYSLDEKHKVKSEHFLLNYVKENYLDDDKVNAVVDILRHSRRDLYESVLMLYITLTQDVEHFKNIWWRGNGGSYTGNVIIGDLQAAEWRNILSIVEKSDGGYKLIPIKKYIMNQVDHSLQYAEHERKRRFLERDF